MRAKTGAKMTTENARIVVDIRLTHKIFTLYLQLCASLSILQKLILRKNEVIDKQKVKVISSNR